jgi:hypothetical protein
MTRRWKPPREDRTDTDAIRRERQFQQDLSDILEYGTEDDFVAALKLHKTGIGKQELEALIMQFRASVREKRGLY